jgi:hypothetical protein
VTSFIVESYAPRGGASLEPIVERAHRAAESLGDSNEKVRHVRSFAVPGDEMCFHVFEATSAEAVTRAAELAGIEIERVVEMVDVQGGP